MSMSCIFRLNSKPQYTVKQYDLEDFVKEHYNLLKFEIFGLSGGEQRVLNTEIDFHFFELEDFRKKLREEEYIDEHEIKMLFVLLYIDGYIDNAYYTLKCE